MEEKLRKIWFKVKKKKMEFYFEKSSTLAGLYIIVC